MLSLDNRARIYKSSRKEVSNARFLAGNTKKAVCSTATLAPTRYFGRAGCNNFTMPKAKTKGSKKRDGRSNGNLNGESA